MDLTFDNTEGLVTSSSIKPLTNECWNQAMSRLFDLSDEGAFMTRAMCASMDHVHRKALAFLLAVCHVQDLNRPMLLRNEQDTMNTMVHHCTLEGDDDDMLFPHLSSCLHRMTDAGERAYSHFLSHLVPLCLRLTDEMARNHQAHILKSLLQITQQARKHMEDVFQQKLDVVDLLERAFEDQQGQLARTLLLIQANMTTVLRHSQDEMIEWSERYLHNQRLELQEELQDQILHLTNTVVDATRWWTGGFFQPLHSLYGWVEKLMEHHGLLLHFIGQGLVMWIILKLLVCRWKVLHFGLLSFQLSWGVMHHFARRTHFWMEGYKLDMTAASADGATPEALVPMEMFVMLHTLIYLLGLVWSAIVFLFSLFAKRHDGSQYETTTQCNGHSFRNRATTAMHSAGWNEWPNRSRSATRVRPGNSQYNHEHPMKASRRLLAMHGQRFLWLEPQQKEKIVNPNPSCEGCCTPLDTSTIPATIAFAAEATIPPTDLNSIQTAAQSMLDGLLVSKVRAVSASLGTANWSCPKEASSLHTGKMSLTDMQGFKKRKRVDDGSLVPWKRSRSHSI